MLRGRTSSLLLLLIGSSYSAVTDASGGSAGTGTGMNSLEAHRFLIEGLPACGDKNMRGSQVHRDTTSKVDD